MDQAAVPLPDPALVVLVGPSGSGKSYWAAEYYRPHEVVSSDRLRAVVGSGEHDLDASALTELFRWTEGEFDERMRGSAIYRIGYVRWLRNIAVALGNAPTSQEVMSALTERQEDPSAMVREHVEWALEQHRGARAS